MTRPRAISPSQTPKVVWITSVIVPEARVREMCEMLERPGVKEAIQRAIREWDEEAARREKAAAA